MELNIKKMETEFFNDFGRPSMGNEVFFQYVQTKVLFEICKQLGELKTTLESLPREFAKLKPVQ
jgi:hypothetical protein